MDANKTTAPHRIRIADWRLDRLAIQHIREAVFIDELGIPLEREWDGRDPSAIHLLAEGDDNLPIATARMLPQGHIGHVAVLKERRNQGIGSALIKALLEIAAQRRLDTLFLDVREETAPFFDRNGFKSQGPAFMEAGIPYRLMINTPESKPTSETAYREPHHSADESLEQIASGIVGKSDSEILLHSKEAFRTACTVQAAQAKRRICIFSYDLDSGIYDSQEFLDAVKRLAVRVKDPSVLVLVQNNEKLQREGHRLLDLAARLPSKIRIHRPTTEEHLQYGANFMLVDEIGYIYRKRHTRLEGRVAFHQPRQGRELSRFFQDAWEQSEEDTTVRRLSV